MYKWNFKKNVEINRKKFVFKEYDGGYRFDSSDGEVQGFFESGGRENVTRYGEMYIKKDKKLKVFDITATPTYDIDLKKVVEINIYYSERESD